MSSSPHDVGIEQRAVSVAFTEDKIDLRLIGGGIGIHWNQIDEDLSVESIVLGRRAAGSTKTP
jgi:hypothetical protein